MRVLRGRPRRAPADDRELDRALEAMTAPELRAAVRAVLGALDEEAKASTVDTLVARAVKRAITPAPAQSSRRF
jgi:hypothetical protein